VLRGVVPQSTLTPRSAEANEKLPTDSVGNFAIVAYAACQSPDCVCVERSF